MESQKCAICHQPNQQTSIILRGLKKRLLQKNTIQDQEYQQMKSDEKNSHIEIFTKIIDLITYSPEKTNIGCSHKKTYRDFYRKMRCSQAQFKQNCQEVLMELAGKCYQLDLVVQQISTFEDRVLQIIKQVKAKSKRGSKLENKAREPDASEKGSKGQMKNEQKGPGKAEMGIQPKKPTEREEKQFHYDNPIDRGLFYWPYILKKFGNSP